MAIDLADLQMSQIPEKKIMISLFVSVGRCGCCQIECHRHAYEAQSSAVPSAFSNKLTGFQQPGYFLSWKE